LRRKARCCAAGAAGCGSCGDHRRRRAQRQSWWSGESRRAALTAVALNPVYEIGSSIDLSIGGRLAAD
jgi:hypothetical protein